MKKLIVYTSAMSALVCINIIATTSFKQRLKKLNEKPIIQRYRQYALQLMNPQIEVFLAEFPDDPKSQTMERYLYQLSATATIYKFFKKLNNLPETDGEIPEEIRAAYRQVPLTPFIYHIIVNNEIVKNKNHLPYDNYFNAKHAWENYLKKLEQQMIKDLENSSSSALSLQTN